ncbi:MAG TPA: class I SAM-dependent methyltransferase [Gammaproteobacteria bacterium]|nr:class I SAM-dependent methyltransferase [Gammaproteobacteria bacterium]
MNDKSSFVNDVFSSVSSRYDLMNNLMSFGLHHLWKNEAIQQLNLKPYHKVLDLACGTADLTIKIAKELNQDGLLIGCDVNQEMLYIGRENLQNTVAPLCPVHFILGNGQALPFHDACFDRIIIGFGLRNFNAIEKGLEQMYRTLDNHGMLLILEFSKPNNDLLRSIYHGYSDHCIPNLGEWVTGDRKSYQYLVDSIRQHPDQPTLLNMMEDQGFQACSYHNILDGIVSIHKGYKC